MAKRLKLSADDFTELQENKEVEEAVIPKPIEENQKIEKSIVKESLPGSDVSIPEPPEVEPHVEPPKTESLERKPLTAKEPPVEEKVVKRKPGRPPKEDSAIRDFLSVNLAGRRKDLDTLCFAEGRKVGKTPSLNYYILRLIDEDIERNRAIIEKYK